MKEYDDGVRPEDCFTLVRRIRKRMLECEFYNIDYEEYIDKDNLYNVLRMLDCCLEYKYSRSIARREL
mgnify:CR=1 FL=1